MADRISKDDVEHVARLANLALTETEVATMTDQLGAILDHASDIASLDLAGVERTAHPLPLRNVWREDEIGPTLDRDEVLDAAPAAVDDRFEVPSILGDPS